MKPIVYITVGVLAGAYIKHQPPSTLTHSLDNRFDGGGNGKSLCGKIKADHLADSGGGDPDVPPTCKVCRKRDPRFKQ